jgi:hypothetical protein
MAMDSGTKSSWVSAVVSTVVAIALIFGTYGQYRADQVELLSRVGSLEKVQEVSSEQHSLMEDELDVLWVDTQKNKDQIVVTKEALVRFDKSFGKFADAVDRLSISVVRLEERIRSNDENEERNKR